MLLRYFHIINCIRSPREYQDLNIHGIAEKYHYSAKSPLIGLKLTSRSIIQV
jgi:hypothetical protein